MTTILFKKKLIKLNCYLCFILGGFERGRICAGYERKRFGVRRVFFFLGLCGGAEFVSIMMRLIEYMVL